VLCWLASAAAFQERLPHVLDSVWEFLAAQRGVFRVVCVAALRDLKGPEAAAEGKRSTRLRIDYEGGVLGIACIVLDLHILI
jgi:hypothetical protein